MFHFICWIYSEDIHMIIKKNENTIVTFRYNFNFLNISIFALHGLLWVTVNKKGDIKNTRIIPERLDFCLLIFSTFATILHTRNKDYFET